MNSFFKLLPLAVLAALGFFALMPGSGMKPQPAYANACVGDDVFSLRIVIIEGGVATDTLGFNAFISPNPLSPTHDGSLNIIDNGDGDGFFGNAGIGVIRVNGACSTDHPGFPQSGYLVALSFLDASPAGAAGCTILDSPKSGLKLNAENDTVTFEVECEGTPTPTPTVTGTPPTATPTTTATPTGDTVTLSAFPTNPACGSPAFLFATVRNQQGGVLAGQTVTFSAADNLGSFTGVTVSDGVVSTTYTPPTTEAREITISATANGVTGTIVVTTNCAAAPTATSTPVPSSSGTITPPSTGDGGLAADGASLIAAAALAAGLAFMGVLIATRRTV